MGGTECLGKEGLESMRGLGTTTTVAFPGVSGGGSWWQDLVNIGAQTGSQIALAQWGNAPTYQQTATPYGSSTTLYGYAPGVQQNPANVISTPGNVAMGSGTMLLIGGGLLLVLLMSGRKN